MVTKVHSESSCSADIFGLVFGHTSALTDHGNSNLDMAVLNCLKLQRIISSVITRKEKMSLENDSNTF